MDYTTYGDDWEMVYDMVLPTLHQFYDRFFSDHLWVIRTSNSGKNLPLSPWPHRDPCESAQQSPWPKSTRPRPANQRGSVGENDIRQAMQLLYRMAIYI